MLSKNLAIEKNPDSVKGEFLIVFKMAKEKPISKASCCTSKKKTSFLILVLILIALIVLFFPSSHEKATVKDMPVVEMITDLVEVIAPDTREQTDENEREITPVVEEVEDITPLLILDNTRPAFARNQGDPAKLVRTYFKSYNNEDFETACDLIVDTKCDAKSSGSVARFGEEFEKLENGYENLSLRNINASDFHSDVICVEYDYRYTESSNPEPVHEIMSFYVLGDKITYRICEAKIRGEEKLECPIQAQRTFCL